METDPVSFVVGAFIGAFVGGTVITIPDGPLLALTVGLVTGLAAAVVGAVLYLGLRVARRVR